MSPWRCARDCDAAARHDGDEPDRSNNQLEAARRDRHVRARMFTVPQENIVQCLLRTLPPKPVPLPLCRRQNPQPALIDRSQQGFCTHPRPQHSRVVVRIGDKPFAQRGLLSTRLGLSPRARPPGPPQIVRQLVDHGTVVGIGPSGRSPEHHEVSSSSRPHENLPALFLLGHLRVQRQAPGQPTIYIRTNNTTAEDAPSRRHSSFGLPCRAYSHHRCVRPVPVSTRPPLTLNAWSDFSVAVSL